MTRRNLENLRRVLLHLNQPNLESIERWIYRRYLKNRIAEIPQPVRFAALSISLIAQSAALAQQIAHLTDAIAEKGHSRALLDRLNALELEQGGILLQIASIEDQIAHAGALSTDQLQDLIDAVRPALQSAEKDQVRSALRSFIDHITIDRDEKTILGQIVFYVPDLPDGYAYEKSHRPVPLHTYNLEFSLPVFMRRHAVVPIIKPN